MNKPCKIADWDNVIKPDFFWNLLLCEWVRWGNMTDEEKTNNPNAYTCEGYLKQHSYKDAWAAAFEDASEEDIKLLKKLPNWDAGVFEEITGLKIK